MKYKVGDLEGALLDAAVALADGLLVVATDEIAAGKVAMGRDAGFPHGYIVYRFNPETGKPNGYDWMRKLPSRLWSDGGPIIERESIAIRREHGFCWQAVCCGPWLGKGTSMAMDPKNIVTGETPLQAAMRAYVSSRFGEEVELP